MGRQEIHEITEINPHTGLPKHVYDSHHIECLTPQIRGTFQMRGKKYHTTPIHYTNDAEREEAIEKTEEALNILKTEVGYWDYLDSEGWRTRVREQSEHEYCLSNKNNRQPYTVLETVRSGNYTIRHITSD